MHFETQRLKIYITVEDCMQSSFTLQDGANVSQYDISSVLKPSFHFFM